jgi:HSP20 family molecular chaperone IbpA
LIGIKKKRAQRNLSVVEIAAFLLMVIKATRRERSYCFQRYRFRPRRSRSPTARTICEMTNRAGNWMWSEACALIERAERLQRDLCRPGMVGAQDVGWEPPVDVYEGRHQVWVVAALPGVEQSDLDVAVERDILVVSGFRRLPTVARDAVINRLEVPHGRFERRVRIASRMSEVNRWELVNGCLYVVLTKAR